MASKIERVLNDAGLRDTESRAAYVREGFLPKIKRVLGKIPFAEQAVALYYAAFDKATPAWSRRIALAALAYFIIPIDFIPDALVIAGYTDDASILAMAVAVLAKHVTPEHRERAKAWLEDEQG